MQINMFKITVPLFVKALWNLKAILSKSQLQSEEKGFDINYLLNFRLYPDQLPLYRQVRIACVEAKNSAYALTGIKAPEFKKEEADINMLHTYIDTTLSYLNTLNESDFDGAELNPVPISFIPGKYLTGYEYISEMILPNFYFHITTAYSILRHNGISLGKKDYIGELSLKDEE